VNEVFCWTPIVCEQYTYTPCDQAVITFVPGKVDTVTPVLLPATLPETVPVAVTAEIPVETAIAENVIESTTPAELIAEMPAPLMPKARFVNSRMAGYRAVAREVIERSNNNPLAVMAQAYFNDPSPTPHKTDTLITRLLENVKPEEAEIKRLSRDMKKDLVTAIVCYYLDKISFDHKDSRQIKQSNKTFEKLRKAKIGIQNIYEDWNGAEVKKYEPGVDLDALHELVTGVKK
jgi:hypothetical protein